MTHEDALIQLIDAAGAPASSKPRRDVDKLADAYGEVHILFMTPAGLPILSRIPENAALPNRHVGRLGTTVATILRVNETVNDAAMRALDREVSSPKTHLRYLGDTLTRIEGPTRHWFLLTRVSPLELLVPATDIVGTLKVMSPADLDAALATAPETLTPALAWGWKTFARALF